MIERIEGADAAEAERVATLMSAMEGQDYHVVETEVEDRDGTEVWVCDDDGLEQLRLGQGFAVVDLAVTVEAS